MLEDVFREYLGPVAAMLVIISVIAYVLPSRLGERISDVALAAFLGVVLFGLVLTAPHFIGSAR
jgi:type IV secretory pathway VirB2 component (pilin)